MMKRPEPASELSPVDGLRFKPGEEMALNASISRVARTQDGAALLDWLRRLTVSRVLPPSAADRELWYLEGQRGLFALIDMRRDMGGQAKKD